jgi:hypothetical protein
VLCAGYAHLSKKEVTISVGCVETKQHRPCMEWCTAANQTLYPPFPPLCKTVSCGQSNEMRKLVFGPSLPIMAPRRLSPERQKKDYDLPITPQVSAFSEIFPLHLFLAIVSFLISVFSYNILLPPIGNKCRCVSDLVCCTKLVQNC